MLEYKEAASLKLGDEVDCLSCGKRITLTHDTFKLNSEIEYIVCPHCGRSYDTFLYLYRKLAEKGEEEDERISHTDRENRSEKG